MCAFPGPVYSVDLIALHDRYWHKADMLNVLTNVSLRGKADGDQPLLTNLDLRVMFKPNTEQRVVAFDFFETPRDVLRQTEQLVARKNFLQAIGVQSNRGTRRTGADFGLGSSLLAQHNRASVLLVDLRIFSSAGDVL